jgi:hypothetical protein
MATTTFLCHGVKVGLGVSADYDARNARCQIAHTSFRPCLEPHVPGWLRVPDHCNLFLTASWCWRLQLQQDQLLDSCSDSSRSVGATPVTQRRHRQWLWVRETREAIERWRRAQKGRGNEFKVRRLYNNDVTDTRSRGRLQTSSRYIFFWTTRQFL